MDPDNSKAMDDTDDNNAGFDASAGALTSLTTLAENKNQPPTSHIHGSATSGESHAWLAKILPQSTIVGLENKFHLGNYVIDRQTGEKTFEAMSVYVRVGMHLLYYGSQQEKVLHWQRTIELLKAQSEKMGVEYDSSDSKQHIIPFIESFDLQGTLVDMVEPDPSKYATFNEFFGREIKESARPIAEPENEHVTSSPADCRLTAYPTIDLATKYWIKGYGFSVSKLLGDDPELAQYFDGAPMVIARLAPQDYHRWHSPVPGTVTAIRDIPGTYYTVNPQAINEPGTLDVFCENKRSVMTITQSNGSKVVLIAVGAMLVGSIKYMAGVSEIGATVRRGQCLGAFYYGGSTVIVLYPHGEVVLDEDLVRNSEAPVPCETLMKVGWRTGISSRT